MLKKEFLPPTPLSIKTVKEASAVCRSFLDGVIIFIVKLQSLVLRLEVDFVFPLSQEEQPQPKIYNKEVYYRSGILHLDK